MDDNSNGMLRKLETSNSIDRDMIPFIRDHFKHYEYYWGRFLDPLTGYPDDPNWREDTHPELERIGVASFGLIKSLNFIRIKQTQIHVSAHPDQNFKNVYFHFSLAIDSVNAVLRSIAVVSHLLQIINIDDSRKSHEKLKNEFDTWLQKYDVLFLDMIAFGKPVVFMAQSNSNAFLKYIVTDKKLRRSYTENTQALKNHRNFFAHNPGVDVFKDLKSSQLYTIRKEDVKKSRSWANLRRLYTKQRRLFIDPQKMIYDDLMLLSKELTSIWPYIIDIMQKIYDHPEFDKIFKNFARQ